MNIKVDAMDEHLLLALREGSQASLNTIFTQSVFL